MSFPDPNRFGVKICGITTAEQGGAIADLGADALGLNFWPKSKRFVAPAAAGWASSLKQRTTLVAVLVNAPDDEIKQIIDLDLVHILQLHGDESADDCARIASFSGLPVIKALQVRDQASLVAIGDYPCEAILLDAWCPGSYGGEGRTFPWELAIEARQLFADKQFILAGGLTAANVAGAVAGVQPAAVDVASGVETAPGVKDLALVRQFLENARNAAHARA